LDRNTCSFLQPTRTFPLLFPLCPGAPPPVALQPHARHPCETWK
jgi:hypothetical protein